MNNGRDIIELRYINTQTRDSHRVANDRENGDLRESKRGSN